ncbi:glycoside hydrolase family 127 protein [Evansella halocellulosilytica]|uniref:glycoside hydrolase family 127 protein n=1 Tax=Evansella halocellulosilytica TaxID=2011013 RepID=UPI000BB8953C|nr:glycoside hydrolase family 127 protein [Evansella halocellulosilytica]
MPITILREGMFKESQEKGKEYLIYLDVDRLLAPFYEAVNKQPKKPRYGGWESAGISGHSLGHWLSAASHMYDVTKDEKLIQKLHYALDELTKIQSYEIDGYLGGFPRTCFDRAFTGKFEVDNFSLAGQWVPWYSLHKVFAGLIDAYTFTGITSALTIVERLADWAVAGTENLTAEQFERMLTCEHGGMNEAMADLYLLTKKDAYLKLAIRFCHEAVLEPLARGIDELEGRHANTQIPKVIGAAKLYNITGDQIYKNIALFFWDQVTKTRSYIIGGNSINEHFGPIDQEKLGVQSAETCNTYNMLKLTEIIYGWSYDSAYIDFYERALYNHILASQDPDSGMKTYFVSTEPGHFKVYCSPDHSFWCCTGTGMENPARYTRNIYKENQEELYVNLFIDSDIHLSDGKTVLRQETDFPKTDKTTLTFIEGDRRFLQLHIRVPYWVAGKVCVNVNGKKEIPLNSDNRYVTIGKEWGIGDTVEVQLPMDLHLYEAKDDSSNVGIMYGPLVLAGVLGRDHFPESDIVTDHLKLNNHPLIDIPTIVVDKKDPNEWVKKVKSENLRFMTEAVGQPGNKELTLRPFYNVHHERYSLYWRMMMEEEYNNFERNRVGVSQLQEVVIDEVQPYEQQSEVEHGIRKENSNAGYSKIVQSGWRETRGRGFFSYEMAVNPNESAILEVGYFGGDKAIVDEGTTYHRHFDILIDGTIIANQLLENSGPPASTFAVRYPIPEYLTKGNRKVEVCFASEEGYAAGGIYFVKIVSPN